MFIQFALGNLKTVSISSWSNPLVGYGSVITEAEGGTTVDGAGQVSVHRVRSGNLRLSGCTGTCSHKVTSLKPGTSYFFRLRAHTNKGWNDFSGESDVITTKSVETPSRPRAPEVRGRTSSYITLLLSDLTSMPSTIDKFEVQYSEYNKGIWSVYPNKVSAKDGLLTVYGLKQSIQVRRI
jgi:hypothetical protein